MLADVQIALSLHLFEFFLATLRSLSVLLLYYDKNNDNILLPLTAF